MNDLYNYFVISGKVKNLIFNLKIRVLNLHKNQVKLFNFGKIMTSVYILYKSIEEKEIGS